MSEHTPANLGQILAQERTHQGVEGGSKKRALETIASCIAADQPHIDADELFRNLIARERLGSTGIGHGIAIPHCRVANLPSITGALFVLSDPVDFDAIDNQPVDVIFVLVVPEDTQEAHLQTLSMLAERFNDPAFRQHLRDANTDAALYDRAINFRPAA